MSFDPTQACLDRPNDSVPASRLLSNGRYTVLLTSAGTGFSMRGDHALSRWSGDRVEDGEGWFIYLRDLDSGDWWSLGLQPTGMEADARTARYEPGRFRLQCENSGIEAVLDVCVSPDDDLELRRVTLRNRSNRPRRIEITSYLEVVLNHPAADAAHPAFSKLFVQTEFVAEREALLARRRPRSAHEVYPWLVGAAFGPGELECETDRMRFLGRNRTPAEPQALRETQPLSGGIGNVLDPVFALRRCLELAPNTQGDVVFLFGAAEDRMQALKLIERCSAEKAINTIYARAAEGERELVRRLDLTGTEAEFFQALAGALLYGDPKLRAPESVLRSACGPLVRLDRYGLPFYRPIVLVRASDSREDSRVAELIKAQRYWLAKGLRFALMILSPDKGADFGGLGGLDQDIFIRAEKDIAPADLDVLYAAARLVVDEGVPPLQSELSVPSARLHRSCLPPLPRKRETGPEELRFFNGYGGFAADGTEYVVRLDLTDGELQGPPLPWINVVANENFGFLVSEQGAGYTWHRNSREHRLTPWFNDPVSDSFGEALYLRDEETGAFWSPLPGPCSAPAAYEARHGFGYSRFTSTYDGLDQDVVLFAARHDPVKIFRWRLTNGGASRRRLSLFSYQRLILGGTPSDSSRFVITRHDPETSALFAINRQAGEFSDGVAFAAAVGQPGAMYFTADRESFIGRNASPEAPAALLARASLDGRNGANLDPCAALQLQIDLEPGQTFECAFLLGETLSEDESRSIIERYRQGGAIENALAEAQGFWRDFVSGIQIETPSPEIDLMVNGWLAYQNLSCRIWGRSAFYQSGGAFGYRDQLQDASALIYLRPELTRAQILLHAAHQFVEGDVLHWWHPEPLERGLRTRFSDDLVWLPYVTAFYIRHTGDWSVLDESAPFVTARLLAEGEDEAYLKPDDAGQVADIYEHCCRVLDRSLTQGAHGLPLMGTGDWNDGMNRVGREGRGESVWMGFFLYHVLEEFLPICEKRGDQARIEAYRAYRAHLYQALNDAGWDGDWYRRAYYDDGTPLGTKHGDECRIDALAQAWAVISGAAPAERANRALDAVEEHLISDHNGLIRLLTPPFVNTPHDPGYIKGYVAGVRENGGQYTHAACWVVRAVAELGRNDRAARLLEMLSPVSHARTQEETDVYRVEPYVVAADVYGEPPHVGRGGWTWYTGSAGWMYRVALESILGFRVKEGAFIELKPCIPAEWPEFVIRYRHPGNPTRYTIRVTNPNKKPRRVLSADLDGRPVPVERETARIPLLSDGRSHDVVVILG
ncbi:GH36-type glycosyl hydrolase domain-containing protein [Methylocaldum gracile subsp. desertum]|uniref:GH36-type glycosyl hydrolase domain-containing protein n=1 Tax=Methylocaldum sp. GT1BW TaxID=3438964 RepID=UPI003DA04F01